MEQCEKCGVASEGKILHKADCGKLEVLTDRVTALEMRLEAVKDRLMD